MFLRLLIIALATGWANFTVADELPPFPKQVPPILGTAVLTDAGTGEESSEYRIALTIPKIQWEIVGELVPKKEWPQLKTRVEKVKLDLVLGGPSQLAESSVVDLKGNLLSRLQVIKRLAKETPVLISVSGQMPDRYYLQLTQADALLVVLGPRNDSPRPDLLPAKE